VPSVEALAAYGARVTNTTQPEVFLDRMFYVSGEIPRVTTFERGFPGHQRRSYPRPWTP
jgi:7,8-dihydropterin-6-yl-methyl-4-(beta-D-ribofuranosyl)aminobenzene 5'-phosphate synthase